MSTESLEAVVEPKPKYSCPLGRIVPDEVNREMQCAGFLKLECQAQPLIHRSLPSRRQRAGMFSQKASIEGQ